MRSVLRKEHERGRIVLLELARAVDLHVLAPHVERVGLPLERLVGRVVLDAAFQAPQVLGRKTALVGRDLATNIEATALVTARQGGVDALLLAGAQRPGQTAAVHRGALVGKRPVGGATVLIVSQALLGAQAKLLARALPKGLF